MTTSQRALVRTTPRRSALTLAKAQVSQHLSHRLPYYITPEEAHQLIDAADNGRDRLFLRLLWETGEPEMPGLTLIPFLIHRKPHFTASSPDISEGQGKVPGRLYPRQAA